MSKVLVSVECPAVSDVCDVYIPDFLTIRELAYLLGKGFEDYSNHNYVSSGNEFICLKDSNVLLNENETVNSCGIQNGDCLVLI